MKFWREKILNMSSYKRKKKTRKNKEKFGHCGWQKLLVRDEGKSFKPLLGVSWAKARGIDGD